MTRVVIVKNPEGLHARPAHMLAKLAGTFSSQIEIIKAGEPVDGKSILSILTLGAEHGTELTVSAIGPDAEEAVGAIAHLFESEFHAPQESPGDG